MTFACADDRCIAGLQTALGLPDPWLARILHHWGFDETCADLVPWVPAIAIAWIDGLTLAEHQRLVDLIESRHQTLSPRATSLLTAWLCEPPPPYLVRVARRTLCEQMASLPIREREALRARVLGPCAEIARTSGGRFGFGAVSVPEAATLQQLSTRLTAAGKSGQDFVKARDAEIAAVEKEGCAGRQEIGRAHV